MYICAWQAPALPPDALISSRITLAAVSDEAGAAVLLRDQRRQPAVLGQRRDELLRVAVRLEPAPVLAGEAARRARAPRRGSRPARRGTRSPSDRVALEQPAGDHELLDLVRALAEDRAPARRGRAARRRTPASSRSRRGSASPRARPPRRSRSRTASPSPPRGRRARPRPCARPPASSAAAPPRSSSPSARASAGSPGAARSACRTPRAPARSGSPPRRRACAIPTARAAMLTRPSSIPPMKYLKPSPTPASPPSTLVRRRAEAVERELDRLDALVAELLERRAGSSGRAARRRRAPSRARTRSSRGGAARPRGR